MKYYLAFRKFYQLAAKRMCRDCQRFLNEGSKILDLGCGSAIVAKEFQRFFKAEIFGLDIIDQRVEKIPFQIFDGINIPFADNYFDNTLISYVLHHVQNPIALLEEAKRVTKKRIFIYEDLPEGFLAKLRCQIHSTTFSHFFQKNEEKGTFKNEKEWKKIFEELRLKIIFEKKVSSFLSLAKKKLFILEKTEA